jgi:predicted transcriptional regulator
MKLILPAELDARFTELAQVRNTSKHALIIEAVSRFVTSTAVPDEFDADSRRTRHR